jgi:hypothetical protein
MKGNEHHKLKRETEEYNGMRGLMEGRKKVIQELEAEVPWD